jgi:hypothetical protein
MGLPAKWNDAEHGLCLSLWAAVTYLKEHGVTTSVEKNVLYYTDTAQGDALIMIEPVQVAAVGTMYPVKLLDTFCTTP